jgi:UDP-N-acetylmuramate dehydrogenase
MSGMRSDVDLKPYHTFGLNVSCSHFCEVSSGEEFRKLLSTDVYKKNRRLVLGGGSNVLFLGDFKGLVIKNNILGIEYRPVGEHVFVKAAAGVVWHDLVLDTIDQGFGGLENLSLIPGCVGASPMQNIGAYGVEIKDVFVELEAYSMENGERRIFSKRECAFGYRESIFKRELKDQYLITSVTYRLSRQPVLNTTYGAITEELKAMNVIIPTIRDVSRAVISIRQSKLPDPKEIGNAGSFFKNPEVSEEKYRSLHGQFPKLVAYPLDNGNFKLAAGWLIEQCGLKGFEQNGAAVHDRQALVLVNKHNCQGSDIYNLSELVLQKVNEKFGVNLEREVNIIT